MRPIVFLDMDGVVNDYTARKTGGDKYTPPGNLNIRRINPVLVKLFEKIIKDTDSRIVISSSWRSFIHNDLNLDINNDDMLNKKISGNKSVINALEFGGFTDCKKYIIGNTKRLNVNRGFEIKTWLEENNHLKTPYIIIDDTLGFTEHQKANHLVRTSFHIGLTPRHVSYAIELINKQSMFVI